MSLHSFPQRRTSSDYLPQASGAEEIDRVISLSRQKLRFESARDEPDLRKLLAHVCTAEHVKGWLREHPPRRRAPSPMQDLEVNDLQGQTPPSLYRVKTESSLLHHWSAGELRPTVTVVREVEDDDEADDDDDDGSDVSWNESDTSEESAFEFPSNDHGFWQSDSSPAITICQDFAYGGEKTANDWAEMPKLLSVSQCRELATMICT